MTKTRPRQTGERRRYSPRRASADRVPLTVWLAAARLRTLPVAIAPVLVGTAFAVSHGVFRAGAFVATILGAVFIQIGTNFANDYSDAKRGADTEDRLGPVRVTAGGLAPPKQVLRATWVAFGVAVLCGIYLTVVAGWLVLAIGFLSILAGVLYTGGPRPYGYEGLGELFVFLFFGLVAVAGSYYVQTEEVSGMAFALAVPVGLQAAAVLMVNNIRDIATDGRAGKRTVAVRVGRRPAQRIFALTLYASYVWLIVTAIVSGMPWLLLALATFPVAPPLARVVAERTDGASLNETLARTAMLSVAFSLLMAVGLLLTS